MELLGRVQAQAEEVLDLGWGALLVLVFALQSISELCIPHSRPAPVPQLLLSLPAVRHRPCRRDASEALAQRWGQASFVLSMSRWMAIDHRTLEIRWLRPAAGQNLSGKVEILCNR